MGSGTIDAKNPQWTRPWWSGPKSLSHGLSASHSSWNQSNVDASYLQGPGACLLLVMAAIPSRVTDVAVTTSRVTESTPRVGRVTRWRAGEGHARGELWDGVPPRDHASLGRCCTSNVPRGLEGAWWAKWGSAAGRCREHFGDPDTRPPAHRALVHTSGRGSPPGRPVDSCEDVRRATPRCPVGPPALVYPPHGP